MFKWFFAFLPQKVGKRINRHDAQIVAAQHAHVDAGLLDFLIPDDQRVRNLFHLRLAHLVSQLLVAQIEFHTHSRPLQRGLAIAGEFIVVVGHCQNTGLDRSKPCRKSSGEMFGQDADKTLNRTHDGAMHHDRPVPLAILAHV